MQEQIRYVLIPLFLIVCLCYFLQTQLFFSGDVGYLLHVTNEILLGKKYGQDILETNPPMILYLYMPVCLIAKYSAVNIMTIMRIYTLFLASISAYCSYFLLKGIFKPQDKKIIYAIYYMLLFILFLLPADDFAQREHFLMILILPYLFSTILILQKYKLPKGIKFLIGIAAGAGFALKPYFLAPLLLIELNVFLVKKSFYTSFRMETFTIASVFILYLISIYLFQPSYFKIVLPLVSEFYFIGVQQNWLVVLLNEITIFTAFIGCLYFIFYKEDKCLAVSGTLMFAMIGMLIAFILPRTAWYYHVLPALALAFLLLAYYIGMFLKYDSSTSSVFAKHNVVVLLSGLVIAFTPVTFLAVRYGYYFLYENNNGTRGQVIAYVNNHKNIKSIFCFSVKTTRDCFPLVYATQKEYGSRYPFFWWIRGMLKHEKYPNQLTLSHSLAKDKEYLIDKVADDLNKNQTDLILLNTADLKAAIDDQFDLISYLLQNTKFRDAWKHYEYLTNIDYYQIYIRKGQSYDANK